MANAVGGIKVQVRESDLPNARDALERPTLVETPTPHESDEPAGATEAADTSMEPPASIAMFALQCPHCGSAEVTRPWISRRTVWAAVVALMLSGAVFLLPLTIGLFIVYLILMRPLKCAACRNEWTKDAAHPPIHGFPVLHDLDDPARRPNT
jgi:hypothetical protein